MLAMLIASANRHFHHAPLPQLVLIRHHGESADFIGIATCNAYRRSANSRFFSPTPNSKGHSQYDASVDQVADHADDRYAPSAIPSQVVVVPLSISGSRPISISLSVQLLASLNQMRAQFDAMLFDARSNELLQIQSAKRRIGSISSFSTSANRVLRQGWLPSNAPVRHQLDDVVERSEHPVVEQVVAGSGPTAGESSRGS